MISSLKFTELGEDYFSRVTTQELNNSHLIHINKDLKKDHVLSAEDLVMKRPGDGISPMKMDEVIGMKLTEDCGEDHKLTLENLSP